MPNYGLNLQTAKEFYLLQIIKFIYNMWTNIALQRCVSSYAGALDGWYTKNTKFFFYYKK